MLSYSRCSYMIIHHYTIAYNSSVAALSTQYLQIWQCPCGISFFDHLQCDPEEPGSCDSGCDGGLMNSAFEYTLKAGGLMREEDYPYTGTDRGACKYDKSKIAASVANFSVVSLDEDQIAANLVKNGPLAGKYLELSFLSKHFPLLVRYDEEKCFPCFWIKLQKIPNFMMNTFCIHWI